MASEIKVDTIVNAGGDNDTGIDLSTNDIVAVKTANTERMRVDASGNVGIGTSSPSGLAHVYNGMLQVGSKTGDTSVQQNTNAIRIAALPNSTTEWGGLQWYREFSDYIGAEIIASRPSSAEADTDLIFKTSSTNANATERMRIDNSGNILIGKTSTSSTVSGIHIGTEKVTATRSGGPCAAFVRTGSDGSVVDIQNDSSTVGSISVSGSSTAFNTSSDYRLKENIVTDWDATTRLKQLKPSRFNFIADADTTVDGFLAHEAQSVVPEAVTGTKDAVDADGNPEYQGIDQAKLVPLLTKALQEAVAKIETLEAKVTALESK